MLPAKGRLPRTVDDSPQRWRECDYVTRYRERRTFRRERVACNVARGTMHSFSEWRALQSIVRN